MDYLGAVSIGVLAVGLGLILIVWPQDSSHTFSMHIAKQRSSIIYYVFLFGLTLPPITWFLTQQLAVELGLPLIFNWLVYIAVGLQFACVLIPETKGWRVWWHRHLAASSAFVMMPAMLVVALNAPQAWQQIICFISLVTMIACTAFLVPKKGHYKYVLPMQAAYYALFFVPILLVYYA